MVNLENNAVHRMFNSEECSTNPSFQPILQITTCQEVKNSNPKRHRVVLSDGTYFCQSVLNTSLNAMVEDGAIATNVVIRLKDFMINTTNEKKVIIVVGVDVLENPGHRIGQPVSVSTAPKSIPQDRYSNAIGSNNNNNMRSKPTLSPSNPYARSGGGGGSAPIMRTNDVMGGKHYTPINALNLYQNRWTIKARVTNKSDIRHWSNSKGDGQLFSIEMLDTSGLDIRATFFREAVDKFYPMLECDRVYTFSGGKLKVANMQYNNCKSQFEITFDQNAEIHLQDDTGEITQQLYEFKQIADLESVEPGKFVDIIGIVKHVSEPSTIVSKKTGKELQKCELTIGDDSGAEVSCTVWGERAMNAPTEFADMPVVAFRRARVSDYGGRTLSASGGNGINVGPRIEEANRILKWWQQGGSSGGAVKKLTSSGGGANRFPEFDQRKTISAIKGERLGQTNQEKPDWISFKGSVSFIKSDREGGAWYPACPNADEPCKNRYKVQQGSDGLYFCEKCQRSYDSCMYRFIFSATISDATATTWVSVFDDQAKVLFDGMTADELQSVYDNGGQDEYDAVFNKAQFTDWVFTCKVKQEAIQDEMRVKTSIQSLHKMDYAKEGRSLLNSILAM